MAKNITYKNLRPILPEHIKNTRALLCILIIMSCLAALSLLFSLSTSRLVKNWNTQLSGSATIQVIINDQNNYDEYMRRTQVILQKELGKAKITPLNQIEATSLLKPWLGDTKLPSNLPIPGLITIETKDKVLPIAKLKTLLAAQGIQVNIDDNSRYSNNLKSTGRKVNFISTLILIALLIASSAVNIFAARTNLITQKDIISVLVQIGAQDKYISKLFIHQAAKRAFISALIGSVIAIFIWLALSLINSDEFQNTGFFWGGFKNSFKSIWFLIILCLLFTFICAFTSGIAAIWQLRFERRLK